MRDPYEPNISTYTASQQAEAIDAAIERIEGQGSGVEGLRARFDAVGVDHILMVRLFEGNGPTEDDPTKDARSLCEGIILGIAFVLELQA